MRGRGGPTRATWGGPWRTHAPILLAPSPEVRRDERARPAARDGGRFRRRAQAVRSCTAGRGGPGGRRRTHQVRPPLPDGADTGVRLRVPRRAGRRGRPCREVDLAGTRASPATWT